jgi:CcmD family protein
MSPAELKRNFQFMFYAFSVVWIILAVYAVSLLRWGRKISEQIDALRLVAERSEKKQ